jgi:hypothetical protein
MIQRSVCQNLVEKLLGERQFIMKPNKNATDIYRMSKQVYGEITITKTKFYIKHFHDRKENIIKTELHGLSLRDNYTDRPSLVGEVSANFWGVECVA